MISDQLPYKLPKTIPDKVKLLADITKVNSKYLGKKDEAELLALSYMVMYRHLGHLEKQTALKHVRSLENKQLMNIVLTKLLDTTFVNPSWGMWSRSNSELNAVITKSEIVLYVGGAFGFTAGLSSGLDGLKTLARATTVKAAIQSLGTLAIILLLSQSQHELNSAKEELSNRTTINTSSRY